MKVVISFLHLEHTESLDERIQEKSKGLKKYLVNPSIVRWSCRVEKKKHHAELEVVGQNGTYHAAASEESMYKTVDVVLKKIKKQITKKKEKAKSRRLKIVKNPEILDVEEAWGDYDEDFFKDVG